MSANAPASGVEPAKSNALQLIAEHGGDMEVDKIVEELVKKGFHEDQARAAVRTLLERRQLRLSKNLRRVTR